MTIKHDNVAEEGFGWSRLWVPLEPQIRAEPDLGGVVSEPKPEAVALRDIAETPCLVLLGEAGIGKTWEVEGLAEYLRANGAQVDLVRGSDASLPSVFDALLSSDHQQMWAKDSRPWHILIDGIDEIGGTSQAPEKLLGDFLDRLFETNRKIGFLKLVLTCRTSAWTDALDQLVQDHWPAESFRKVTLEPLGDADIRTAIERVEPEETERERLTSQLLDETLRAVAGQPFLLALLLDRHRAGAPLPTGQADLIQLAIKGALAEPPGTEVSSRVAIAARLAAASTFSDLRRLTTVLGSTDPSLLPVSRIAGGVEPVADGSVTATPALFSQCLRSILFVEVQPRVFEWSHRIFSDFLTARYLAEHRLSPDEILSLLIVPEVGGPGGVAPQLLEVAGWTAVMVPAFFDALLERQPDVLLQAQAAALEPEDRARLAGAILQRFAAGDLLDQYDQLLPLLVRLDHTGLADQLRPVITDSDAPPFERRAAIDFAAATGKTTLSAAMVDVAADPKADGVLRMIAARAVWRMGGREAGALLSPVLSKDMSSDTEDRLRGALLTACWPNSLSFRDLLGALTIPKKTNFIGTYQLFLSRFLLPDMMPERALEGISWLRLRLDVDNGEHDRLRPVMGRLFWAVATQIAEPAVRQAMAGFIIAADHGLSRIATADAKDNTTWPDDAAARAGLVEEVLQQSRDPLRGMVVLVHYLPDLIRPADLNAYLARLPAARDDGVRAALAQIIVELAERLPIDTLDSVWEMASRVPALQPLLTQRYSIERDSPAADHMRRGIEREREARRLEANEQEAASAWKSAVTSLLDRIESGQPALWWQLNLQLFHQPAGDYDSHFEFDTDLTKTPGWQALGEGDHERILRTAPLYLVEAPLTDTSWLGTSTSHRPANAGLRALRLLRDKAPSILSGLPEATWAAWAPATVGFFGNDFYDDGNAQRAILREAYRKAPTAILAAIRQIALGEKSEGLSARLFELLEGMLDPPITSLLEELRGTPDLKGDHSASAILSFLVRNGDEHSVNLVLDALSPPARSEAPRSSAETAVLAQAAIELLLKDPRDTWFKLLELRERDEAFARSIWSGFAKEVAFNRSPALNPLSEYALAQAYIDLAVLLPERPPNETGARVLRTPDYVEQLRSILLSRLIAIGTNVALEQLYRIEQSLPDARDSLRWSIEEARRNVRSNTVRREDPAEILARIGGMGIAPVGNEPTPRPDTDTQPDDTENVPIEMDIPGLEPDPSGPLATEERRTILAVTTEWSSFHGGISTLNRELCTALAALGHTVICLVLDATPAEMNDAKAASVELVACPSSIGIEERDRFLLCQIQDLGADPDVVIGHDHITGRFARALATRFDAKYVHFLHTIPHENEGLKGPRGDTPRNVLGGEFKMENQLLIAGSADLIVAVGPRIQKFFLLEAIDPPPVSILVPGLSPSLLALTPDPAKLPVNACFMSGRMEDAVVKGGLLACDVIKMVGNGRDWSVVGAPVLVMRGFSVEEANAEFAKIGHLPDYAQFVQLRSFSTDPVKLQNGYLKTALILMPSVAEGFGLTGLEAIAAGVPVIISAASGLADYLRDGSLNDGLSSALVEPCIAPVNLTDAENRAAWAKKVDAALCDRSTAFKRAAELRHALSTRLTWDRAARKLSFEFQSL